MLTFHVQAIMEKAYSPQTIDRPSWDQDERPSGTCFPFGHIADLSATTVVFQLGWRMRFRASLLMS